MKVSRLSTAGVLAMGMLLLTQTIARADSFNIDPVHSTTIFRIHHLNAGYVWGFISGPTGTFDYDASDPTKLAFDVTVNVDNMDTSNKMRDNDIKGPDWLDAKQFPTMSFKSSAVKKTGDNSYDVTGDFTLHGVTKSITVSMEMTGVGAGMRGETRTGFETTFTIHRSDYDMSAMQGAVGDDVRIIVGLEGVKQ
jgi:polyisoprenoid-binding protein YceI